MRCRPWRSIAGSVRSLRHSTAPRTIWPVPPHLHQQQLRHSGSFRANLFTRYYESIKNAVTTYLEQPFAYPDMADLQTEELKLALQMLGLTTTGAKFKDVVFVCVDCEAFEFQQDKITEVGVAVLDMREFDEEMSTIRPDDLISRIRYAHYRITEYAKMVNKRFVKGCPEDFGFGESIWVRCADARYVLDRVFRDPAALATAHLLQDGRKLEERNVVIVGHDLSGDTGYLKHLDFDLTALKNVVGKADTQRMASAKKARVGLSRLLKVLNVEAKYLHNAGNDAAYTMQALVLMAVKDFQQPGSVSMAVGTQRSKAKEMRASPNGEEPPRPNKRERKRLEQLYQKGQLVKATEESAHSSGSLTMQDRLGR